MLLFLKMKYIMKPSRYFLFKSRTDSGVLKRIDLGFLLANVISRGFALMLTSEMVPGLLLDVFSVRFGN